MIFVWRDYVVGETGGDWRKVVNESEPIIIRTMKICWNIKKKTHQERITSRYRVDFGLLLSFFFFPFLFYLKNICDCVGCCFLTLRLVEGDETGWKKKNQSKHYQRKLKKRTREFKKNHHSLKRQTICLHWNCIVKWREREREIEREEGWP